jgi:hypothetical protein
MDSGRRSGSRRSSTPSEGATSTMFDATGSTVLGVSSRIAVGVLIGVLVTLWTMGPDGPPLDLHVRHVVSVRTKPQVTGVAAQRVVAGVAHRYPIGDLSDPESIGNSGRDFVSGSGVDHGALIPGSGCPLPAVIDASDVEIEQESLFQRGAPEAKRMRMSISHERLVMPGTEASNTHRPIARLNATPFCHSPYHN